VYAEIMKKEYHILTLLHIFASFKTIPKYLEMYYKELNFEKNVKPLSSYLSIQTDIQKKKDNI